MKGMRKAYVILEGRSLEDRLKVRDLLLCHGEKVYSDTTIFFKTPSEAFPNMLYSHNSKYWVGTSISTNKSKLSKYTIEEFLSRFTVYPVLDLSVIG